MSLDPDRHAGLRSRIMRIVRQATGLHEQMALPIAESICGELAQEMDTSGHQESATSREARNAAIRREFRGDNHREVMRRYRISQSTLYRVVGEKRQ